MPQDQVQEMNSEDLSNDTSAETPEVSSNEVAETNTDAPEVETGETGEEGDGNGEKSAAPAYTPNTKYKVDGKELEFDDKVKKLLTKDSEPILRELVEKAHGIEAIKGRHAEVKQERDTYYSQLSSVVKDVREILGYRDAGDLDSFFEATKVPFEKVVQHVYSKLKAQEELPEQYRGVYDENRSYRQQLRARDQQVQEATQQANNAMLQARSVELDTVLSSPEVTSAATELEDRLGGPGSFRNAVIEFAAAREHATQRPVTAKEAVDGYLKLVGRSPGSAKPAAPTTTPARATHKPQTLPNVGTTAISPTGTKPKNLKELRELSKNFSS